MKRSKFVARMALAAMVALCALGGATQAAAQQYLRIGTGGTGGTYFPVGTLIAGIVAQPGKILATAQASNGSLGNVIAVNSGALETGFSQADVAAWAKSGTGIFEGRDKLTVPDLAQAATSAWLKPVSSAPLLTAITLPSEPLLACAVARIFPGCEIGRAHV